MTTTYLIELRLNEPDLLLFLEHARMFKASVTAVPEEQKAAAEDVSLPSLEQPIYNPVRGKRGLQAKREPRAKRGSKVTESIINRLKEIGSGDVSQLKHALTAAGLSENSLSTGLAILQKNGTIQRDGNGRYLLSEHEGIAA